MAVNGNGSTMRLVMTLLAAAMTVIGAVVMFGVAQISENTKGLSELRGLAPSFNSRLDRFDRRLDRLEDRSY